jgi:hypothetical protein
MVDVQLRQPTESDNSRTFRKVPSVDEALHVWGQQGFASTRRPLRCTPRVRPTFSRYQPGWSCTKGFQRVGATRPAWSRAGASVRNRGGGTTASAEVASWIGRGARDAAEYVLEVVGTALAQAQLNGGEDAVEVATTCGHPEGSERHSGTDR